MAGGEKLPEPRVQGRLTGKRAGKHVRLVRLRPFLLVTTRVPFETSDEFTLRLDRFLKDDLRFIRVLKLLYREGLQSPAKQAHLRAVTDRWRHLQAPMRGDSIEFLFVAMTFEQETLLHPVT
jgi:hypothetical protein